MKIAMLIPDNRDEFRNYSAPDPIFGPAPTALLQGFAQLPGCELHIISCTKQPLRAPSKIAPNTFYHSLIVPRIGWLRGGYVLCVRAIRKKLQQLQPDIVHGHGTERYCALASAFSGFPNVITIHGIMRRVAQINQAPPFSFHWLAAKLERFTVPRAGGVICLSTHTRQNVERLNRTTWVVPNAVDDSFFAVNPEPVDPPQVVCIADVLKLKNQNALITALDSVAGTIPFKLRFFGKADRTNSYVVDFLRLVQSRSWCEYAGFVDRSALHSILGQAAVVALPSLEDNCPMSVLEAMAAGTPVAAARVGGVPDLISHETDGLLFDPTISTEMGETIRKLLIDSSLRVSLAKAARAKAEKSFRPLAIARRHVEIYHEVTAK